MRLNDCDPAALTTAVNTLAVAIAARLEDYERIFGFRPQHYRVQPSGAAVLL